MTAEKITIKTGGMDVFTIENCAPEESATFNVPSSSDTSASTEAQVAEGVRRVVSEYGEALKKLSNEE